MAIAACIGLVTGIVHSLILWRLNGWHELETKIEMAGFIVGMHTVIWATLALGTCVVTRKKPDIRITTEHDSGSQNGASAHG
jgi:hypothetical protein